MKWKAIEHFSKNNFTISDKVGQILKDITHSDG